jgi:hypothetical protein
LFNGIVKIIQQRFNAHGHRVETLHGDAERVNISLSPYLGTIGTNLKSLTQVTMPTEPREQLKLLMLGPEPSKLVYRTTYPQN